MPTGKAFSTYLLPIVHKAKIIVPVLLDIFTYFKIYIHKLFFAIGRVWKLGMSQVQWVGSGLYTSTVLPDTNFQKQPRNISQLLREYQAGVHLETS